MHIYIYLIDVYSLYLPHICFMLSLILSVDIIIFIVCCCCCCCCLLLLLVHFVAVVLVLLFILFYCRSFVLCCLCCQFLLASYYSFSITTLWLFLVLFSFLSHCISNLSYCHCFFYDWALAFAVWLLLLLVYNFLYGDSIVIYNVSFHCRYGHGSRKRKFRKL